MNGTQTLPSRPASKPLRTHTAAVQCATRRYGNHNKGTRPVLLSSQLSMPLSRILGPEPDRDFS